jgi:peptidoglycan hydrolase CwlO-like protein
MSEDITKEILRIQFEIGNLQKELEKLQKEITDFDKSLFHPDEGVYKRISTVSDSLADQHKMLKALERKVQNKFSSYENKLGQLEDTEKILKDIGGENLVYVRLAVEKSKKSDKILWMFGTTAIAGLVKLIYDIVISLLGSG